MATRLHSQFLGPHPDNRDFLWRSSPGPYRYLDANKVAEFDERGFLVIEKHFDSGWVAAACSAIEERLGQGTRFNDATYAARLVGESDVLRDLCFAEPFPDLCWDLVGPDVRLYWDQAVYKRSGPSHFPWHQDNGYTFVQPQQYLTCWVALTDATLANGCPWLMPGLHLEGTLEHRQTELGLSCLSSPTTIWNPPAGAEPAVVRAGSIVVFSSLTPHATGPNETASTRKSYILQFAPSGAVALVDGRPSQCDSPHHQFSILSGGRLSARS